MSNYTQEQIKEMRKRLPFKAKVEQGMETTISHIFNNGNCANNDTIWDYFEEVKDPKYVPFTAETIKPFRDEWVTRDESCCNCRIMTYDDTRVTLFDKNTVMVIVSYSELVKYFKSADSGKPFGKEVES